MSIRFNRYTQNFIALIPFLNIWYGKKNNVEVINIGWLKWSSSIYMEKAYERN